MMIAIYLHLDCLVSVTVKWICTVNLIKETVFFTFEKPGAWEFSNFGEKINLFEDGIMQIDFKSKIKFTPNMIQNLKNTIPQAIVLLEDEKFKDFIVCVGD